MTKEQKLSLVLFHVQSQSSGKTESVRMEGSEGIINDLVIENMMNWRHSGFNVYCGKAIWPHNEEDSRLIFYINVPHIYGSKR